MNSRKTAFMGLLLSFALILSYVESLIPFAFGIPGMKLGLPNLAVVMALYLFSPIAALLLNCLRIMLAGFLFGNLFSILYALAGGLVSFFAMCCVKALKARPLITSIVGGICHNLGQILAAIFIVKTIQIAWYFPPLAISGAVTGALIGILTERVMPYFKRVLVETQT